MTTLPDRPNTALVVVDVQNRIVAEAWERDAIVANIASVVDRARAANVPVVWVKHSGGGLEIGSEDWQDGPELSRKDSESLVAKTYPESFEDTTLEAAGGWQGRAPHSHGSTDRRVHSVHASRSTRPRI